MKVRSSHFTMQTLRKTHNLETLRVREDGIKVGVRERQRGKERHLKSLAD